MVGFLGMALAGVSLQAEELTISDVMNQANKGQDSLLKAVLGGEATEEQKQELVRLYEALPGQKPPMGPEEEWVMKTDALVAAAKAVAEGQEDGLQQLRQASNCKACHSTFRP